MDALEKELETLKEELDDLKKVRAYGFFFCSQHYARHFHACS